jgi:carboxypeptidase family protein
MRTFLYPLFLLVIVAVLRPTPVFAQQSAGRISGAVTDSSNAALPGAQVQIQNGPFTVSDGQGEFTIGNLAPGSYTLMVSYVGFSVFQTSVTVAASQTAHVNAVLNVASESESIIVTAERTVKPSPSMNQEVRTIFSTSCPLK